MKNLIALILLLCASTQAGVPVYDGPRHATDIIDNIQDILDQINQINNQIEQIEKLSEQIEQMEDFLELVGKAADVRIGTEQLENLDLYEILLEIEDYISGYGLTDADRRRNTELFGDVDKQKHILLDEPVPEKKYDKHEKVELEFAAYKKSSLSLSSKRFGILAELKQLGQRLNSATTDQQVQKLNAAINAHKLMLTGLKDEEDRQYHSFIAELEQKRNAQEKERTRHEERMKFLDKLNRTKPQRYSVTPSAKILELIEGGQ